MSINYNTQIEHDTTNATPSYYSNQQLAFTFSPLDDDAISNQIINQSQKASNKKEKKAFHGPLKPHQKFSPQDDETLRQLVAQLGESNWISIAESMPGRNSRQCRERWLNYLSPNLNKGEFTQEEDSLIVSKVEEFGNKWVTIAKTFFPNRTDQMIKNRYYMLKRKAEKRLNRLKRMQDRETTEIPNVDKQSSENESAEIFEVPIVQNSENLVGMPDILSENYEDASISLFTEDFGEICEMFNFYSPF